jgi:hypothetical protein
VEKTSHHKLKILGNAAPICSQVNDSTVLILLLRRFTQNRKLMMKNNDMSGNADD